jgi:hypothetical protein
VEWDADLLPNNPLLRTMLRRPESIPVPEEKKEVVPTKEEYQAMLERYLERLKEGRG